MAVGINSVSIGLPTFLRDEKLFCAVDGIRRTMPDVQMIIADDGDHTEEKEGLYAELIREGHKVILCPYDSGYGYKHNEIVRVLDRPFLLRGCDDFDFRPPSVAVGVKKMLAVFEENPWMFVISGRVNERVYEFFLYENEIGYVQEIPVPNRENVLGFPYRSADLTVNYSLIKKQVFKRVRWDDDVKIGGGEHGAFFVDLKRAGYPVGYLPDVNINTQLGEDDQLYRRYRDRANSRERPCFVKRGIKKYVLGNGLVDYEEK